MATITDADLDRSEQSSNLGEARAARYLRDIPEALRSITYSAGVIYSNTHPGYRLADGVGEIARRVKAGWTETELSEYIKENR